MEEFLKIFFSWVYLISVGHVLAAATEALFRSKFWLMFPKILPGTMTVVWLGSVLLVANYLT